MGFNFGFLIFFMQYQPDWSSSVHSRLCLFSIISLYSKVIISQLNFSGWCGKSHTLPHPGYATICWYTSANGPGIHQLCYKRRVYVYCNFSSYFHVLYISVWIKHSNARRINAPVWELVSYMPPPYTTNHWTWCHS